MEAAIPYPYIETLVGALFAFILGVIWYRPKMLGERWLAARGVSNAEIHQDAKQLITSLVLWLMSACFYSFLVLFLHIDSVPGFFCLSCMLWVAFSMPPTVLGALYTGYAFEAVAIDAAYHLAGYYVLAGAHLGIGAFLN